MSELLDAAKAVIDAETISDRCNAIGKLRAAVERAEKQEAVGFEKWWEANNVWPSEYTASASAWIESKQAERERIRVRAKMTAEKTWEAGDWYIGPQHNMIEAFVDALLEDGDE